MRWRRRENPTTDDGPAFASGGAVPAMMLFPINLTGPLKAVAKWFLKQLVRGIELLLNVIVSLFITLVEQFIYLDPDKLATLEPIWTTSVGIYFSLLAILALSVLGMYELFPTASKVDPYRMTERALAATFSLFVVNPPGKATSLFSRGLFAWAFVVVNAIQRAFLSLAKGGISLDVSLSSIAGSLGGIAALVLVGYFMAIQLLLSMGTFLLLLGVRKVLIYAIYGMYPLFILFWVVDVGPAKYANEVASMAFKAVGILLVVGVLVSGFIGASAMIAGGSTAPGPESSTAESPSVAPGSAAATAPVVGGTFSSASASSSDVGTGALAGETVSGDRSRIASGPAPGPADTKPIKKEENRNQLAKAMTGIIAIVAMALGGSTIMSLGFGVAGLGSVGGAAKKGASSAVNAGKSAAGNVSGSATGATGSAGSGSGESANPSSGSDELGGAGGSGDVDGASELDDVDGSSDSATALADSDGGGGLSDNPSAAAGMGKDAGIDVSDSPLGDGDLSDEEAVDLADGDENEAAAFKHIDQHMADSPQNDSTATALPKKASKGSVAAAGMAVGSALLPGIGGAVLGGAAGATLKMGADRAIDRYGDDVRAGFDQTTSAVKGAANQAADTFGSGLDHLADINPGSSDDGGDSTDAADNNDTNRF